MFNNSSGKLLGSMMKVDMSEILYFKTILRADTLRVIIGGISFLIMISGYLIHIAERIHPVDCS